MALTPAWVFCFWKSFCRCLSLLPAVSANFAVPSLMSSSLCVQALFSSENILSSSRKSSCFSLGMHCQHFSSRYTGLLWRPETIAFRLLKFFRMRNSCAISIHVSRILARSCDLSVVSARIVEMTRRDTALNWFTVATTVAASWLLERSFLDQTAPRHWWATSFLNTSASIRVSCSAKWRWGTSGKL